MRLLLWLAGVLSSFLPKARSKGIPRVMNFAQLFPKNVKTHVGLAPPKADLRLLRKWRQAAADSKSGFVILFLDLSTSVDAIAKEYEAGYRLLMNEVSALNPYLLLFGFNFKTFLLYEGPACGAPRFDTQKFCHQAEGSLLNSGTALFDALALGSRLVFDLNGSGPVAAFWLTDGLDTASSDARLADAVDTCGTLRGRNIVHDVIGVQNPRWDRDRARLDALLRQLLPAPAGSDDVPRTCQTLVGFRRIRDRIMTQRPATPPSVTNRSGSGSSPVLIRPAPAGSDGIIGGGKTEVL